MKLRTKTEETHGLNVLAFDTSSPVLTVSCVRCDGIRSEANLTGPYQHSENLFSLIDHCLKCLKLDLREIDAFGIGMGPGSFTGLRIGFSCLKGFALACGRPLYGISSLDLIAEGVPAGIGRLAVIVNARRERIYCAFFRSRDGVFERESPEDEVLSIHDLKEKTRGEIAFTGDALLEYGDALRSGNPAARFLEGKFWYPRIEPLVRMIQSRSKRMKPLDLESLKPQYLRLSEAEEKLRAKRVLTNA